MSETCETVKVKTDAQDNEQGFVVINKADFDEKVHTLYQEPKAAGKK